ncbi:MAG: ABC transport system ATP-binding protein [Thermacetogenium phaeum]|uniref:ABC transport system ATP-binding protein n=1 Tax=Thermacetogenium phaeum TaxID=85874 RepID=A0A101FGE0_9THEO|nr:MAG: ABC transport system ATP-binding protein [Thermacetogenium phaeum]
MQDSRTFRSKLNSINNRGYKAYQELQGEYDFGRYRLFVDHVQGDPFAAPSRVSVRVYQNRAKFPASLFQKKPRRIALCDYLARCFSQAVKKYCGGIRGTGKSGLIFIDSGKQEILERSAVVINESFVEARFFCGLPARGRTVLSNVAEKMFFQEIPEIVEASLYYEKLNHGELLEYVNLAEDQEYIRESLSEQGLVAFIANGSVLPRRSGISDLPLTGPKVISFQSPASLEVSFNTPNHGEIKGMGIPQGVTLIVGGGFHGKSTLLHALERGVYNHIPGDGREWVITVRDAVKIRAEEGRRVEKVDITPFINNLPFGQDTRQFSTDNASGSTSQAANIIEALEMGCKLLLIDEDTSATNFMIRDGRMQALVTKDREPITPFLDQVRPLYEELGVSSVLVIGGSGDYLDVADHVIMMNEYSPVDVTKEAEAICSQYPARRVPERGEGFGKLKPRIPLPGSFDPQRGRKTKVGAKGLDVVQFGHYQIELDDVEQLVDPSQTRAIADIIYYAWKKYFDGRRSLSDAIRQIEEDLDKYGLDVISPFREGRAGDYALPRRYEIAAAINRLRSLEVR